MIVREVFSRFQWVFLLGNKSDAKEGFEEFQANVHAAGIYLLLLRLPGLMEGRRFMRVSSQRPLQRTGYPPGVRHDEMP